MSNSIHNSQCTINCVIEFGKAVVELAETTDNGFFLSTFFQQLSFSHFIRENFDIIVVFAALAPQ